MSLLPPPPVPVNQLAEVGCLLAVFDNELVLEELLGCGTLHEETAQRESLQEEPLIHQGAAKCSCDNAVKGRMS